MMCKYRGRTGALSITDIEIVNRILIICPRVALHVKKLCCQFLDVSIDVTNARVVVDPSETMLEVGEALICTLYSLIQLSDLADILEDVTMSVTIMKPMSEVTSR
jgi:hypothetical protein